ncbi:4-O-beta-D-mannosyl-D-glucose phosphorylase [bioreactor metagenome]|uniref:4-O-beta-D-mannosyl-D-glucose phosphorylase n=1 Tax=bioreactor metagenome TaxID=1076179 RepID=A0A644XMS4_9ZZZZ
MFKVKNEGILLEKTGLDFENDGVLNPAVMQDGNTIHMFYRAVSKGNFSTIGYCRLDGPLKVCERNDRPLIIPESDYESHGVEDARIVKIDDLYYLTYTAYDGINAQGALAISADLVHFEKKGIIVAPVSYVEFVFLLESAPPVQRKYYRNHLFYYQVENIKNKILLWDKNVIFFPRKINGKFCFLHRIRPGIQIVEVNELSELTHEWWRQYFMTLPEHIVMDPRFKHESQYIGGGCPPIETKSGWLLIYHGVEKTSRGLVYSACAALLDLNDPSKELARLPAPLFTPQLDWEISGVINNVVFPTGTALFDETLYIYYGAADERIGCVSLCLSDLINELTLNITS